MSIPENNESIKYRPINLDEMDVLNKNIVDAALVVEWTGYGAVCTAQAGHAWENLSTQLMGQPQPPFGNLHEIPDTTDLALLPSDKKGSNSLIFRYPGAREFTVNLKKVLALAKIKVTRGHRLIIPVTVKNLPEFGECFVLQFTRHRMEKLTPKPKAG